MTVSRRGLAKKALMWGGWALLVLAVSIFLGSVSAPLGWLSLVALGAGGPIALRERNRLRARDGERQLLDALAERDQLTSMTAALRTSLTLEEAAGMLDDLAVKGHVETRTRDGVMAYGLREKDRLESRGAASGTSGGAGEGAAEESRSVDRETVQPSSHSLKRFPEEPLTGRELEVLRLVASGRSNKEISGDLFLALGTVKNHTSSAYRKLGAKNRAEAIARARELGLL